MHGPQDDIDKARRHQSHNTEVLITQIAKGDGPPFIMRLGSESQTGTNISIFPSYRAMRRKSALPTEVRVRTCRKRGERSGFTARALVLQSQWKAQLQE